MTSPDKSEIRKNRRQRIGVWGEKLAEKYLMDAGCEVVEKNFRSPYGEIDLIVRQREVILFVEVKTRTNLSFGFPELSVNSKKRRHLIDSVEAFFQVHPELMNDWRIDVISILGRPDGPDQPQVMWFENAIT